MSSVSALKERNLNSRGVVQQVVTDTPVAIRVRHTGSGSTTSVTVTTATNIVLVDSVATTTVAFATYTTLSAVVGAINASGTWEAKILDALLTQASASTLLDGAITSTYDGNGNVVWDVSQDTSTALQFVSTLSPFRSFDSPKGHRVHLQEVKYAINMGTAAADSFQIWERNGGVETKVFGDLSVDTTATTYSFASGYGKLSAKDDREIIVLVKDAATLSDATSNYLRLTGIYE